MGGITPAGLELLRAIHRAIESSGEARSIRSIVLSECTLPLQYAYMLLSRHGQEWGLNQRLEKRPQGGYEKCITKQQEGQ